MPRPFHHDLRRDARGKSITDKGATTSVRTEQGILRSNFINTLITLVVGLADRFINPCKFGKLPDIDSNQFSGFSEEVTLPEQEQIAELLAPRFSRGHPLPPLKSHTAPFSFDDHTLLRRDPRLEKTKSNFLRARLLDESFKVITEDESTEEYYRKLSNITAQIQKIGILYNQTVRAINSYHSVKAAQVMLQRLEQFSQQIIILEQQAISLTLGYRKR